MIRYDKSFISPVLVGAGAALTIVLVFLDAVSEGGFLYRGMLLALWIALVNFFSCRVSVDEELVTIRFGIGLIQKVFTRHSVAGFRTSENEKIVAWIYRPFAETSLVVTFRDSPDVGLPAVSPKELADLIDISGRR